MKTNGEVGFEISEEDMERLKHLKLMDVQRFDSDEVWLWYKVKQVRRQKQNKEEK